MSSSSSTPSLLAAAARPRVLLTADTVGGVWTFALDLAREIAGRGGVPALATMGRPLTPPQRAAVGEIQGCTLFESSYRLDWMPDPWADVDAAGEWLLEIERKWQPDVVHCNTLTQAALPWQAPTLLTVHSCVFTWYQAVKGHNPPRQEWADYYERVRRALCRAGQLIAPTAALAREVAATYHLARERIQVIPNGRATGVRTSPPQKQRHLLAAGRLWDEGKNTTLLASIAPRLHWPCLLAGDTGGRIPDAPRSAVFLGRLSSKDMEQRMRDAAVFLHPALYEPFGLAPLEAAQAGCALILSDIPTLREVWGERNALFVDPRDPAAWVERIEWLTAVPGRWQEFGARARQQALSYSRQRMGEAYFKLYERAGAAFEAPMKSQTLQH